MVDGGARVTSTNQEEGKQPPLASLSRRRSIICVPLPLSFLSEHQQQQQQLQQQQQQLTQEGSSSSRSKILEATTTATAT